jgi:hypothetical protein
MGEEMDGCGWLTWRVAAAAWLALHVAARVADALWWRPRRLEAHFAAQGVRGPPYRFLLGSVRELAALMAEASSKPMSPATSHNALPRVLAFYHYWRKIYGAFCDLSLSSIILRRFWLHDIPVICSLPLRLPAPLLSLSLNCSAFVLFSMFLFGCFGDRGSIDSAG